MTALYLKHVALRQFRSFATLDVKLPAEPGVFIVHGTNGLGKSSLFDALEWTLSDQINHFRGVIGVKKTGKYLCRWRDGEDGPTTSTLTFSDNSTIKRSLASSQSTTSCLSGNVNDVAAYLRAPSWQQQISGIENYLLLTHFLGQSTQSRLTYRDSSDLYEILKEAAQSKAIEAIADVLHGHGNSAAVRAYTLQIAAFESAVKSLHELLEQEFALWTELQMSGAIDEASVASATHRIAKQLAHAQISAQGALDGAGVEAEPTIELLQATAIQIERDCLAAEQQLENARRLYREQQRALADIAEVGGSLVVTQTRLSGLSEDLEQTRILQSNLREDAASLQQDLAIALKTFLRLQAIRDARSLVAKLETEHRGRVSARAAAEQAKVAAEKQVVLAERRKQMLQRLSSEIGHCNEEVNRVHEIMSTVDQLIMCDKSIRNLTNELAQLEIVNPEVDQAVLLAEAAFGTAADRVNKQKSAVEGLRDTVDHMSIAIASIASHLPTDSCECPVCATHFDSASSLRTRVSTAAQRLAPALVTMDEVLEGLSIFHDIKATELKKLRTAQSYIHLARASVTREREQRIRLLAGLDDGSSNDMAAKRARLADAIADLNARRRRKVRWQTHHVLSGQTVDAEHSRAIRARDGAQRSVEAASRASADSAASLELAKADEAKANALVSADRYTNPDTFLLSLEQAESTSRRIQDDADKATRAMKEADVTVAVLDAEQAGLRARLEEIDCRKVELDHKQRRIIDDWVALGPFGAVPDLAAVEVVEIRIVTSRLKVKEVTGDLTRLREGRLAWSKQLSHRAVLDRICERVEAPPNLAREELLARASALRIQKEAEAEAVNQVKEIARSASAAIRSELADFNAEYIKPLTVLMSQINQAILCAPRVGINFHVKRKKIEQSAMIGHEFTNAFGEIDPVLVHSEGQMAALAVSMLCAASLTYPWSRWKALVLDDPLQNNDSIHAAAFADLMGNLVSAKKYQILLSTHDIAQAEFLQRKFKSRKIPCTTLNLLGLGKDGVEWTIQDSSSIRAHAASA